MAALDAFLAELPRSWNADDEAAIARAKARQGADGLRKSMWRAHHVAAWLRLPDRIGYFASLYDRSQTDPKAPSAWPADLSPAARAGLNALFAAEWGLVLERV